MSKEKQIEQMARTIDELLVEKPKDITKHAMNVATYLFDRGYRKQEWISIDDRLPDTDEVLVYCRKGVGHAAPKKQGLDKMDWDVFFNITRTTHWMPLPQPPKMKGGAE